MNSTGLVWLFWTTGDQTVPRFHAKRFAEEFQGLYCPGQRMLSEDDFK